MEFLPKSSGIQNRVRLKTISSFPYQKEKNCSILSGLPQQLAHPVSAAGVDLAPHVEGGHGRVEHDQVFFFEAKAAHSRRGVKAACSGQDLPGDGEGGPSVLELPDMC